MKQNTMMRLASALLVAVMLSTSVISGTYAKYVTEGDASDTARVAKWGIVVSATGDTFAETYATNDTSASIGANSVVSLEKVVAPGTSGDILEATVTGNPEVAFRVSYEITNLELAEWLDKESKVYFPLVFTVYKDGNPYDSVNGLNVAGSGEGDLATYTNNLKTAINNILATCYKDYDYNEKVGTTDIQIAWEWPFSTSETNDAKDTYLGDQAAGYYGTENPATIDITLTTTVTQLD